MSLIGSMRNKKLLVYEAARHETSEDVGLSLHERVNEFMQKWADSLILPYLDRYERDKFGAGNVTLKLTFK